MVTGLILCITMLNLFIIKNSLFLTSRNTGMETLIMPFSGCFCCHILIIIRSSPRNFCSLYETCPLSHMPQYIFLVKYKNKLSKDDAKRPHS